MSTPNPPLAPPSTPLPNEWIARLLKRFRSIYGNNADAVFGKADFADLVETWAAELGRYTGEDLRRALEAMRFAYKEFPPTLFQFADLCRDAAKMRGQTSVKVDAPRPGEPSAEVLAEIHRLTQHLLAGPKGDPDCRNWARRILQRAAAGERMPIIALTSAREALGITG